MRTTHCLCLYSLSLKYNLLEILPDLRGGEQKAGSKMKHLINREKELFHGARELSSRKELGEGDPSNNEHL